MNDIQFVYAVSRVRANEMRLLTMQDIDQLLSLSDVPTALRMLGDKGWDAESGNTEDMLRAETRRTWDFIAEICDDPSVFDILRLRNDFHNLKAKIKSALTGRDAREYYMQPSVISPEALETAVEEKEFSQLPDWLGTPAREAFDVLLTTRDGQLADVILDKAQLEAMLQFGRESGSPFVMKYAELTVAMADLKIAVRAQKTGKSADFLKRALAACDSVDIQDLAAAAVQGREALYDYISHTSYSGAVDALSTSNSAFEKWCDDRVIAHITAAKYEPFGMDPLFAFILARENEIKMVRIVLSGLHNDLSRESIRERLRNLYV